MSEHCQEIHAIEALTFTANGEYLVGGGREGVQVWRMKDSKRVAKMEVEHGALCVAVSKDGKYIAAGSISDVLVWNANTYKQVLAVNIGTATLGVDFSSDHLVFPYYRTAIVWDITTRQKLQTLEHGDWVVAAKYSPQCQDDRIATGSKQSVRVWDGNNGRMQIECREKVDPECGLLWFDNYLFVRAEEGKIKQIDASSGSTISEWSVPTGTDVNARISLSQHGKYIAYSSSDNITFQDTSAHTQLGSIPRSGDSCSMAFSPNDQILAIAEERKIIFKGSSFITGPKIHIDHATLDAWKHGQLTRAEELLTAAISTSEDTAHHIYASRALVRARFQNWGAALADVEESMKIQPSLVGCIAKCVVFIRKGEIQKGCRECDIVFHLHSDHTTVLLLVKAVVLFLAGDYEDAISRVDDLIATVGINSVLYVVQAYMYLLLGNLQMESGDYERAVQSFEYAQDKLGDRTEQPPLIISLISGWTFKDFAITIQQRSCEALLLAGRAKDASDSVLRMVDQAVNVTEPIRTWVSDMVQRCLCTRESNDDAGGEVPCVSHATMSLLREWATSRLAAGSWEDALTAGASFVVPRLAIYQVICEHLEKTRPVADAVSCFRQMCSELAWEMDGENWTRGFKSRCRVELEVLGDTAINGEDFKEAISVYTAALSLEPTGDILRDLLGKRSKAYAGKRMWEDALNDTNKAIELDPFSTSGYENKHQVLHSAGRFADAIDVFEMMHSKISESSDPVVREQSRRFVTLEQTKDAIRASIKSTIHDIPAVLIEAMSGRLCDKAEQAVAFELTHAFTKLVASMTTHIDHDLIGGEVEKFYRYAMLSHTWEGEEPSFEKVTKIMVYDLVAPPTHKKLQMFCKIVHKMGFKWAWADTCCINREDNVVLQEALICMFKWYQGSAMTIIFLRGVGRLARRGAMMRSVWNSRGWTLQEYHASKVVRFYTEDWTPYLGLEIYNHKDSLEIISEMAKATGISAQALMELHPGLDDIREKLHLASTRRTTRIEDAAYSLLGIFSLSLQVRYGEGDKALSRLLAQLLTSSGDTSILAWTGRSGGFNSCLPSSITVFHDPPTSHIPPIIPDAEMRPVSAGLRPVNLTMARKLYDQLNGLSVPMFVGRRLKLPCLIFKLGELVPGPLTNDSGRIFRARATVLGIVEIRTREDLSGLGCLCLISPWIDFLLARQPVGNVAGTMIEDEPGELSLIAGPSSTTGNRQTRMASLVSRIGSSFNNYAPPGVESPRPPSSLSPAEMQSRVLQFVARLRQPFGALLLTRTRENIEEYKRVAAESLITVQVQELTHAILDKLTQSVRTLDVL